ncbi:MULTISPECIES: SLC13 family permease [Rhodanobacter]|uniref:Di-and tricarboxylate transporter n=2 Tax=Gammaproteobacteria TaxID=1236 RepID=A0A1I4FAC6_9GAMM|nr:SLC13 family permease [Rhodanobacter glycinis]QEE23206.1 SLC13 family permease [Rhodanobacter glycinis]SFL14489.1 Di-and tricarboxylate transporter [Rhodanobacter glycinis]
MSWQAWATVAIIVLAMALFASEKVRIDLVALMMLAALVILGIVSPLDALSGFSNEATVTVAAMFALSMGIERSGALEPLIRLLSRIRQPWLLTLAMMLAIAPIGAFVKNIALVATFLPLALRVCQRTHTSPARVLMPMAYAAQMGGVCTLIGTSSNLLADSLARKHHLQGFGVFEFAPLGVVLAVVGITYLMLVGRWLLPRHVDAEQPVQADVGKYVTELEVTADSALIGQSIAAAKLGEKYGVYPLELLRGEKRMWSPHSQEIAEGDVLLVRGDWDKIEDFQHRAGLRNAPESRYVKDRERSRVMIELMVAPASPVEGRRFAETGIGWRYDAVVLAIHRRGQVLRDKLSDVGLAVGDVLLALVDEDALANLRNDEAFIVLSERDEAHRTPRKAFYAVGIMLAVVVVSGMRWLPIPIAAICGAVAMALTGCFGRKDVYEGMDWKIIILLGAILPLGMAIDKTGLSHTLVQLGLGVVGSHGPLAALLMVYLLTALLTELMGHNPSVVLMVGIAASVAGAMHVDPRPFVVAVAFAAATSFATPVGYPTNTMVYYAGGYRFTDFMKVGIPLILVFCALSMWLIPHFWPFHPAAAH